MLIMVLLMVAAGSMGLPVLFNPNVYSSYPDARLEFAALKLFQLSVILSVVFSWLFIILVFVTLFLGGNVHTLGCRSLTDGQLFTFLDQQQNLSISFEETEPAHQFHRNETMQVHPNTSAVYHGCMRGQSMFRSMGMNQLFDLEDFLNSTKYMKRFSETAENMTVNVNDLRLLPEEARQGLLAFRNISLESYDYDSMLLLLSKPVVKTDLAAFAKQLDEKAELSETGIIKIFFKKSAMTCRRLHSLVIQQTADAVNVDNTLSGFNHVEGAMHVQVPHIVANVSQCAIEKGKQWTLRYFGWANHAILNEIMGCQWLVTSVENLYTAVCLNVIDPWNAFWLCLGWCCAFLVPGIVFSIYLIRHLKRKTAIPSFTRKDIFTLPDVHIKKKQPNEKNPKEPEKTQANVYITFEELCEMSVKAPKAEEKGEDT
ncbi:prominin-2-like isoform X2 [Lampris incognitus]|uniref:prominin-2-like isoform X2 n=1 Tax=Lampris incognitus TaxID=2546036 RepID=UPI0024B5E476|nr:prominin-2-like isoform X2 [Lampris incognitus]